MVHLCLFSFSFRPEGFLFSHQAQLRRSPCAASPMAPGSACWLSLTRDPPHPHVLKHAVFNEVKTNHSLHRWEGGGGRRTHAECGRGAGFTFLCYLHLYLRRLLLHAIIDLNRQMGRKAHRSDMHLVHFCPAFCRTWKDINYYRQSLGLLLLLLLSSQHTNGKVIFHACP